MKNAFRFFKGAAKENCHEAFNSLGDVYNYGLGVDIDYEEAFKWYSKAAEEPMDNGGQFNLALMYGEGKELVKTSKTSKLVIALVLDHNVSLVGSVNLV